MLDRWGMASTWRRRRTVRRLGSTILLLLLMLVRLLRWRLAVRWLAIRRLSIASWSTSGLTIRSWSRGRGAVRRRRRLTVSAILRLLLLLRRWSIALRGRLAIPVRRWRRLLVVVAHRAEQGTRQRQIGQEPRGSSKQLQASFDEAARWQIARRCSRRSKAGWTVQHSTEQRSPVIVVMMLPHQLHCLADPFDRRGVECYRPFTDCKPPSYIARAFSTILSAPSLVALPPMKPEACTKMHPGIPVRSLSAWSRIPRHLYKRTKTVSKPEEHVRSR